MVVQQELFFRHFISVGQKTSDSSAAYGEGFNYWVEVGVKLPLVQAEDELRKKSVSVTKKIDHKSLGVDVNLGIDPHSGSICQWLFAELKRDLAPDLVVEVRLLRGDNYSAKVRA